MGLCARSRIKIQTKPKHGVTTLYVLSLASGGSQPKCNVPITHMLRQLRVKEGSSRVAREAIRNFV